MKKIIKLFLLVPFSYLMVVNVASAKNYEFVNGDDTNKTALCMAATVSDGALESKMTELTMSKSDLASFRCNGLAIDKFAMEYRNKEQPADVTGPLKVFAFTTDTKAIAAELCVAASTSNTDLYHAMKKTKTAKNNMYLVRCNGMSIKRFAKKNGNKKYRF